MLVFYFKWNGCIRFTEPMNFAGKFFLVFNHFKKIFWTKWKCYLLQCISFMTKDIGVVQRNNCAKTICGVSSETVTSFHPYSGPQGVSVGWGPYRSCTASWGVAWYLAPRNTGFISRQWWVFQERMMEARWRL